MAEDLEQYLDALQTQVGELRAHGADAQALALAQKAYALSQNLPDPEHPLVAVSLTNLAELYDFFMGHYAAALPLYEQALKLWRRLLGADHPFVATVLNSLAGCYYVLGDYAAAQPRYEQAQALAHEPYERRLGRPVRADDRALYAKLSLCLGRPVRAADPILLSTILNNRATLYRETGDYAAALPFCKEALALRRQEFGDNHPDVAISLQSLATLYYAMGNYAAALPLCERALALRRQELGDNHPAVAASLNERALLYHAMGDYAAALRFCKEALALRRQEFGDNHPDVAQSLHNLAALYDEMGDHAAALPLHEQALELKRRLLGVDHPLVAGSLGNLAVLWAATNRPAEALTQMEAALAIDNRTLGQIFSCGSDSQRLASLDTLLDRFYGFLSLILRYFSASPQARAQALELVLRRKALGAEALRMQQEVVLGGQYPVLAPPLHHLHLLRMQIAQHTLAGPGPEGLAAHQVRLATWHAEKDRLEAELARQIPEMHLERRLRAVDRRAVALALPEAATLVEFVRFPVFNFRAVPAHGDRPVDPARYVAFVLPAGAPDDVQMIDLGEAAPIDQMIATYRAYLMTEAKTARHAGTAPEPGEALGSRLRAALFDPVAKVLPDRCHDLFLAPDGALSQLPFEVLPLDDGRYLTDAIQITYLSAGRDVLRFHTDVQVAPTAPLIAADPDFDLASGTPAPASAEAATGTAPRHSRDIQRDWRPVQRLGGTAVEGERIAALLGVAPWLGARVVETPLKACHAPRILHLATHGGFLADQPFAPHARADRLGGSGMENPMLRSFLLLAGVNTRMAGGVIPADAEDGFLTAEDVSGMHLLGTELVVLSACDTGLGTVQTGEGVMGLRRAFVLAGAQTLVMSLWHVPDIATAILMEQLYRNLLQGQGRAEALRRAQTTLRQMTVGQLRKDWLSEAMILQLAAGDLDVERDLEKLAAQPDDHRPFSKPYYWGGFICQGMPGPLRAASGPEHATSIDKQTLTHYLEGRPAEMALVDRMLDREGVNQILTAIRSFHPQDVFCHALALEGPHIIVPLLRMTPPALQTTGARLAAVMKRSAELAATLGEAEAGRRNFQAEMGAGRPVDALFLRTQKLISEMARAGPQQAARVGEQIRSVLLHNDPQMCALAAVHAATPGIPYDTVRGALLSLHENERTPLIRYAVSAALLGLAEWPDKAVATTAMENVVECVKGRVAGSLPALVHRVRHEYLRDQHPLEQDLLIVKLAIYYALLYFERVPL